MGGFNEYQSLSKFGQNQSKGKEEHRLVSDHK